MSFLWKGIKTVASGVEKGAEDAAGGIKDFAVNGAELVPNLVGSAAVCIVPGNQENCRKQTTRTLNNLKGAGSGFMKAGSGLVDGTLGAGVGGLLTTVGELAKDVGLPGVGNALESKTANAIVNMAAQVAFVAVAAVATGGGALAAEAGALEEGAAAAAAAAEGGGGEAAEAAEAAAKAAEDARNAEEAANALKTGGKDIEESAANTAEHTGNAASGASDIAAGEESGEAALKDAEDKFMDALKNNAKKAFKEGYNKIMRVMKSMFKLGLINNDFENLAFLVCQSLPLQNLTPESMKQAWPDRTLFTIINDFATKSTAGSGDNTAFNDTEPIFVGAGQLTKYINDTLYVLANQNTDPFKTYFKKDNNSGKLKTLKNCIQEVSELVTSKTQDRLYDSTGRVATLMVDGKYGDCIFMPSDVQDLIDCCRDKQCGDKQCDGSADLLSPPPVNIYNVYINDKGKIAKCTPDTCKGVQSSPSNTELETWISTHVISTYVTDKPSAANIVFVMRTLRQYISDQMMLRGARFDSPLLRPFSTEESPSQNIKVNNLDRLMPYAGALLTLPGIKRDGDGLEPTDRNIKQFQRFAIGIRFTTTQQPSSSMPYPKRWFTYKKQGDSNTYYSTLVTLSELYLTYLNNNSDTVPNKYRPCYHVATSFFWAQPAYKRILESGYGKTLIGLYFYTPNNTKTKTKLKGVVNATFIQGGDFTDRSNLGEYKYTLLNGCNSNKNATIYGLGALPFTTLYTTLFVGAASRIVAQGSTALKPQPVNMGHDTITMIVGLDQTFQFPTVDKNNQDAYPKKIDNPVPDTIPMIYTIGGSVFVSRSVTEVEIAAGATEPDFKLSDATLQYLFTVKDPTACMQKIAAAGNVLEAEKKERRGYPLYAHNAPRLLLLSSRKRALEYVALVGAAFVLLAIYLQSDTLQRWGHGNTGLAVLSIVLLSILTWRGYKNRDALKAYYDMVFVHHTP